MEIKYILTRRNCTTRKLNFKRNKINSTLFRFFYVEWPPTDNSFLFNFNRKIVKLDFLQKNEAFDNTILFHFSSLFFSKRKKRFYYIIISVSRLYLANFQTRFFRKKKEHEKLYSIFLSLLFHKESHTRGCTLLNLIPRYREIRIYICKIKEYSSSTRNNN